MSAQHRVSLASLRMVRIAGIASGPQSKASTTSSGGICKRVLGIFLMMLAASTAVAEPYIPTFWTKLVKVRGQIEAVPEQWLEDKEARNAHNMELPQAVAKTVPFNFQKAQWKAWLPWVPGVGRQYFEHLCDTEAGEWILKTVPGQRGIYNARPMRQYSTSELQARYDLEAPVLQRSRQIEDDIGSGTWFVGEPFMPYYFVEEPKRAAAWQAGIAEPFIRLFGYQADRPTEGLVGRPMQVIGIDRPTARYALTWRGAKRVHDREYSVSGVEMIVYDRESGEALALRRQFVYAPPYKNRPESNSWAQGEACPRLTFNTQGLENVIRLPMLSVPSPKPLQWRQRDLVAPLPPALE